jgi:sigma-B regulation protein RsbU (phosphoserine phosphatase)
MSQEKLKILLIEHDPGFAQTLGEMLGKAHDLPAELRSAAGMEEGLSALNRGDGFDVAVLDVCVPDGAGLANIPLLKAEAPGMPVIVAGDSDEEEVAVEAVQAGAQDYLVKSQLTPGWLERSIRYSIERHRADRALHAAARKYQGIFDHLVEGIFQTTPEGRYLVANAALARIYGYGSPEELMENLTDIGLNLYVEQGRRDEFIRLMQSTDTITGFESRIYRKDGSIIWISENCRAIRNSAGELLYYEGTVEDITHRQQTEAALRKSESLYHSLVETMPQNVFRKDLRGRFTFANQQYCKHYNCQLSEILGKTDFDFFPRELAEKYQRDDWRVMETGQTYEIVEEHQPLGQPKSYIQVVKTPLYGADSKIIGLQGIFWDITQQRLAEERSRRATALLAQNRKELHEKNLQMEDELRMAREIQLTMLPQQYPAFPREVPPEQSALQFTHRYLPTSAVGGDFFSVTALSDTEASIFICDVAGHGVRSALVTAMIRALVEELKPCAVDPGRFLTQLNHDLHNILRHSGTPLLTTAVSLMADSKSGRVLFANAGHPKPLLAQRASSKVQPLVNASGRSQAALGLFPGTLYTATEALMSRGDVILLFTDGLYEVQDAQRELYSQALLAAAIQRRLALPVSQILDELLDEIRHFSDGVGFTDDVCLVGIEAARTEQP